MDYGFDDERPSQHRDVDAMRTPQASAQVAMDWKWLERYLPYSTESEHGVNWFVRFK